MVTFRFSKRPFIGAVALLHYVAGGSILGLASGFSGANPSRPLGAGTLIDIREFWLHTAAGQVSR